MEKLRFKNIRKIEVGFHSSKPAFTPIYMWFIYMYMLYILIHLLIYTLKYIDGFIYGLAYILRSTYFSIAQWRFVFYLYFSNQMEFDSKSIN